MSQLEDILQEEIDSLKEQLEDLNNDYKALEEEHEKLHDKMCSFVKDMEYFLKWEK